MKAILLAGGKGTRLRSVVTDMPKPMAPVAGLPFLEILLGQIIRQGIDEVILSVGYRHDVIINHFGNCFRGVSLKYVIEDQPLGTGGAIKLAFRHVVDDSPYFIFNADTFVEVNLSAMYQLFQASHVDVGMVLRRLDDVSRYGRVTLDQEKVRVIRFEEKSGFEAGFVNMGVYVLRPSLFQRFDLPDVFSLENDLFIGKLSEIAICPWITNGYFIDIGIPDDYQRAQSEMRVFL